LPCVSTLWLLVCLILVFDIGMIALLTIFLIMIYIQLVISSSK
jgi:hypothetical protein